MWRMPQLWREFGHPGFTKHRLARVGLVVGACLQLAACSSYDGPITNARPPAGSEGPPGLTNYYAP